MTTKLRAARFAAVSALGVLSLAVAPPANAAPVTHDGCTITTMTPAFNNQWSPAGIKRVDYVYTVSCLPSAAGVSVEVDAERWEQDLAGSAASRGRLRLARSPSWPLVRSRRRSPGWSLGGSPWRLS